MEIVAVILSLLTLGAIIVLVIRSRPKPDQSLVLLQNQLNAMQERLDKLSQTISTDLRDSSEKINTRLTEAARIFADVREIVGAVHEVGKAAAELVNILRAPKLRGGMGELFLGDLLAQILPPEHFRLQHRFKSGEAVDAAIQIGQKLVNRCCSR